MTLFPWMKIAHDERRADMRLAPVSYSDRLEIRAVADREGLTASRGIRHSNWIAGHISEEDQRVSLSSIPAHRDGSWNVQGNSDRSDAQGAVYRLRSSEAYKREHKSRTERYDKCFLHMVMRITNNFTIPWKAA
jgi:hypothetical protein